MNRKDIDYNFLIKGGLIVGGLFVGYKIVNSLLEGIGLKKSDEEKKLDEEIHQNYTNALDAFNPLYYQDAKRQGYRIQDLTPSEQNIIKEAVYKCIGYVYDSPQKCLAAFTSYLKFKTQVSVIAHTFVNAYGESMLGYLTDRLDTDSQREVLNQILSFVANLPSGISK